LVAANIHIAVRAISAMGICLTLHTYIGSKECSAADQVISTVQGTGTLTDSVAAADVRYALVIFVTCKAYWELAYAGIHRAEQPLIAIIMMDTFHTNIGTK